MRKITIGLQFPEERAAEEKEEHKTKMKRAVSHEGFLTKPLRHRRFGSLKSRETWSSAERREMKLRRTEKLETLPSREK